MTTRKLSLALAVGALVVSASAFGQQVVITGRGHVFIDPPSTLTRAQVQAEARNQIGEVGPDGWRLVAGEPGWKPVGASYVFVGGKLAHAEECPLKYTLAQAPAGGKGAPLPESYRGA